MKHVSSDEPSGNAGGFPGVRSLFGRGGFPGTIKLSRKANAADAKPAEPSGAAPPQRPGSGGGGAGPASRAPPEGSPGAQPPLPAGPSFASEPGSRRSSSAGEEPSTSGQDAAGVQVAALRSMSTTRIAKFNRVLGEQVADLEALRELCWSGIPPHLRSVCWRLLLGYLPPNKERRQQILSRKRQEYRDMVPDYYDMASSSRSEEEVGALRQVAVDVPRTAPGVPFFHQERVQKSLERILYIWGIRHPASGYVQGINDLVTPFLAVFMSDHLEGPMESWGLEVVTDEQLLDVEADCYWCLCKLLDGIQDHYTYAQPGIQRTIFHVKELVSRVEEPVAEHLSKEGLEFIQFAFRWVNCLLLREVPFPLGIRLWDTYLAEGSGLKDFLVYVLASFLLSWGPQLRTLEFQDLIMFLQKPPTAGWSEKDVELVLSRAFMWRASFKDATSHFS